MSKKRCRLCGNFAVEGSIFCDDHRERAQLFARTFGGGAGEPGAPPAPPDASATGAAAAEPGALSHVVHAAFERILATERARADLRRWPQISIYYLEDKLIARPYYSIVPKNGTAGVAPLPLDSDELRRALEPTSPVLRELTARYNERVEQLKARSVMSLDLHLLTYARLIGINENPAGRGEKNLATFDLESGKAERTELAAVRARLRHDRWS